MSNPLPNEEKQNPCERDCCTQLLASLGVADPTVGDLYTPIQAMIAGAIDAIPDPIPPPEPLAAPYPRHTLFVSPEWTEPVEPPLFNTIQAAIDSATDATTEDPYSVYIYPGTYEAVTLAPAVNLIGINTYSVFVSTVTHIPTTYPTEDVTELNNLTIMDLRYDTSTKVAAPRSALILNNIRINGTVATLLRTNTPGGEPVIGNDQLYVRDSDFHGTTFLAESVVPVVPGPSALVVIDNTHMVFADSIIVSGTTQPIPPPPVAADLPLRERLLAMVRDPKSRTPVVRKDDGPLTPTPTPKSSVPTPKSTVKITPKSAVSATPTPKSATPAPIPNSASFKRRRIPQVSFAIPAAPVFGLAYLHTGGEGIRTPVTTFTNANVLLDSILVDTAVTPGASAMDVTSGIFNATNCTFHEELAITVSAPALASLGKSVYTLLAGDGSVDRDLNQVDGVITELIPNYYGHNIVLSPPYINDYITASVMINPAQIFSATVPNMIVNTDSNAQVALTIVTAALGSPVRSTVIQNSPMVPFL